MIGNFIFALFIIIIGLFFGRYLRALLDKGKIQSATKTHEMLKLCTMTALLVVNPVIILGAFWNVQLDEVRLLTVPLLGVLTLGLGGVLAVLASRMLKLKKAQEGSMFASGTFSNLGSFGNLFCFVLLGEASLVFVAMFRLFEELVYYTIGFPIAETYGEKKEQGKRISHIKRIVTNPLIIVTFLTIVVGTMLNLSPFDRPDYYSSIINVLVPIFTILLIVPTGFNMKISAVKGYLKESFIITAIKYAIIPVTITSIALLFGLKDIYDGIVLKVIIILSAMPPGFTSLVPPQLYKLDIDLANSSWLLNTIIFFFILPILYFIVMLL
ncbi:hypothetical protein QA612_09450 [Evansella sp. AB-P1]|uniref:AEC family transporter n=1 Tax=Evansella sp. AB-P1 TaxID=3037653 RepID=UPI00241FA846|nr:AEC family transporter [Evansella sp. AB-P1]MDG5787723.1 hypothetical protein [Evansella sp. AB-P1]